jgi:hypothetical protein
MATLAQWQAIETQILQNLADNCSVASYSIGRQTWTFQSLDAQARFLTRVQAEIARLQPTEPTGEFQLAYMQPD